MTPDRVRIAVLDYGIGNLRSAQKALEHLGAAATLTSEPDVIENADAVVLPGVGHVGACLDALRERDLDAVARRVVAAGRPFLGICVGMQMLFDGSEEAPGVDGLGIFPGRLQRLSSREVPVPQMQWNRLEVRQLDHPLMHTIAAGEWMYFVHSFAVVGAAADAPNVIATCDYGGPVVAAIGHDNVMATQFHPEKSGNAGLRLMKNFVDIAERHAADSARRPSERVAREPNAFDDAEEVQP